LEFKLGLYLHFSFKAELDELDGFKTRFRDVGNVLSVDYFGLDKVLGGFFGDIAFVLNGAFLVEVLFAECVIAVKLSSKINT